jgi:hypothetical protein
MKKLEKNWITTPIIDTEYKQYVLLAYLQGIKNSYNELKIYPHLSELIDQYCELIQLKDNRISLADKFPKALTGIDKEEMKVVFTKHITEENWVEEISNIIEMAIPFLMDTIQQGKDIYEELEKNIFVEPVGVEPLKNNEGYLILNASGYNETLVYEYKVSLFETPDDKYRAIHTKYAAAFVKNLSVTNHYIKLEMIRQYPAIPHPTVYAFDSNYAIPVDATYLPIAKRMITKIARM